MLQQEKRATVFRHLSTQPADIYLLQECAIPYKEMDALLEGEWTRGDSLWSGSNTARADGVGMLVANPFLRRTSHRVVESGRILVVDLEVRGSPLRVINIYGPTNVAERVSLYAKLRPLLMTPMPVVVGGDFNCALRDEDRSKPRKDRSTTALQDIINDFSLVDVGGTSPPTHTWVRSSGSASSRIDMFLLSPGLGVCAFKTQATHFSDHRMLTVTLRWEGPVRPTRGPWRMNTSVLQDPSTSHSFSRRYLEWRTLKELFTSPIEWWEMVKSRVKGFFGGVGRRKAREQRARFHHHNEALQRLSLLQLRGFDVTRELSETKEHLATLYREEQERKTFRDKLQGLEEEEKCTRHFFRRARSKQQGILSLYNTSGQTVTDSDDIREVTAEFYGRLFDIKPADGALAETFLDGLDQIKEGGEGEEPELSLEELTRAVHSMNTQKAPGPDGIPAEFYQAFWELVKGDLAQVLRAVYRERRLGESMRQSTVTLLPKKGDLKDLRNWRPINLLCSDYKILTKALMWRFQIHLPTVINPDQTCGVPGRSINDNLLLVRDLIFHSQERRSPFALLCLDQEKAFDRVSHGFLQEVLGRMNFPQHLIHWTRLCYQNITSRVLVNKQFTDPFPIRSGVRQGCPLAPLLYVIYLEPFLRKIRATHTIQGYHLPGAQGERLQVVAYMDDITIVGTDSRSIAAATKVVDDYCAATGALVNRGKSELYLSQHWKEAMTTSFPVKTDNIKLLGVTYQNNGKGTLTWANTISQAKQKIAQWSARSLTITGKILVLKAIILPILLYVGRVFPPDRVTSKTIERLMFTFVWGSTMERLKRTTMYSAEEKGGKGVPDILNIIRAQGLSQLVTNIHKPDRKAGAFERYFATPILRALRISNTTINHTVPYCWDPPKVYKEWKNFAFRTGLPVAGLASWKYKDIMAHIRGKDNITPPKARPALDIQQVWKNISHKCISNKQKDLNWSTAHGCLPTREFMYRRHIARTELCPHGCTDTENIYHLFVKCTVARRVWALFVPSVSLYRNIILPRLTADDILFGPPGGCTTPRLQHQWRIVSAVKQVIWETRNIRVYHKQDQPFIVQRRRITLLLRDYAILDFKCHPDTARDTWGVERWKDVSI